MEDTQKEKQRNKNANPKQTEGTPNDKAFHTTPQHNSPGEKLKQHCNNIAKLQMKLYSYALTLTNNEDEADDLLQEAMLRIMIKIELYKPTGSFTGWTKRVMENEFKNSRKSAERHAAYSLDDDNDALHTYRLSDYAPNAEEIYCAKELQQTVQKLPKRQNIALKLRIAGYKYEEIAEKMNISTGNVKNSIHQARKRLKKELEE